MGAPGLRGPQHDRRRNSREIEHVKAWAWLAGFAHGFGFAALLAIISEGLPW